VTIETRYRRVSTPAWQADRVKGGDEVRCLVVLLAVRNVNVKLINYSASPKPR